MALVAVTLEPLGPWSGWAESDTLAGALCWAAWMLGQDPAALATSEELAVSSLLPVLLRSGQPVVRFYPLPAGTVPEKTAPDTVAAEEVKVLKKVRWLSEKLWGRVATGVSTAGQLLGQTGQAGGPVRVGELLLTREEASRAGLVERSDGHWQFPDGGTAGSAYDTADATHNQIDRLTGSVGEGLLFFERELVFRRGHFGFWLASALPAGRLLPLLAVLGDTGIGANRSTGRGHFRILHHEPLELRLPVPPAGRRAGFMLLGRMLPSADERERFTGDMRPLSWTLHYVQGIYEKRYSADPALARRPVRVFAAGTVFEGHPPANRVVGRHAEVGHTDGHAVYHCGRTVVAPLVLEANR
jgi:CRISPR type III-A-associated RAMP protein Csm4